MRIIHVITRLIVGGAQENTILTCEGLAARISDNIDAYKRAVKAVLGEFFAYPENPFADEVLRKLLESPSGYSRAEAVKQAIHQKESASTIRRLALSEGMTSLRQDAVRKVVAGQTTPEEILRAVYLEE